MKLKDKKIEIGLIAALVVLLVPYAITILYALPSTDDFWMGIGVERSSVMIDSFQKACDFWMGWGGMWIYEFFRTLLNPVVLFGASSSLAGVELLIFFLCFLAAMWGLNRVFWKYFVGQDKMVYALVTYFLMLAWFLNTAIWTEVLYWFCGSAYMWAMSLVMLTVALEMKYFAKADKKTTIKLSIVGAIACSFYSQAVFPCMIFLLFMLRDILNTKKIDWKKLIPFGFFLLGALSAMVAPGNFARRDLAEGQTWGILGTFRDTAVMWKVSLFEIVKSPLFMIIMVLFVAVGMVCLKEAKYKYAFPVIPFVITVVCLYVTYFPFALGYGGYSYLPNRAVYVYNMFAVMLFAFSGIYFGGWLRYRMGIELVKKDFLMVGLCLVLFAFVSFIPTETYGALPYYQVLKQTGHVKNANAQWKEVLKAIETSKEDKVYVETGYIETLIIKSPGITNDVEDPNNRKVAAYYGKDLVQIIWK